MNRKLIKFPYFLYVFIKNNIELNYSIIISNFNMIGSPPDDIICE